MADLKTPADLASWTAVATKERKREDPADLIVAGEKGVAGAQLTTERSAACR